MQTTSALVWCANPSDSESDESDVNVDELPSDPDGEQQDTDKDMKVCDHAPALPLLPCMPCDRCPVTQDRPRPKRKAAVRATKVHARVQLSLTKRELQSVDGLAHLGLRIGVPLSLRGRCTPGFAP